MTQEQVTYLFSVCYRQHSTLRRQKQTITDAAMRETRNQKTVKANLCCDSSMPPLDGDN